MGSPTESEVQTRFDTVLEASIYMLTMRICISFVLRFLHFKIVKVVPFGENLSMLTKPFSKVEGWKIRQRGKSSIVSPKSTSDFLESLQAWRLLSEFPSFKFIILKIINSSLRRIQNGLTCRRKNFPNVAALKFRTFIHISKRNESWTCFISCVSYNPSLSDYFIIDWYNIT